MLVHEVLTHGVRIGVCWAMGATRVTEPIICDTLKSHPYVTRFDRFHISVLKTSFQQDSATVTPQSIPYFVYKVSVLP